MTVSRKALCIGIAAGMLCPAAGIHGFLETLIQNKANSQAEAARKAERNVGRTVMDALKLAVNFDSPGAAKDAGVPHAESVFNKYDKTKPTGYLSVVESSQLLKELGFDDNEVMQMQKEMDANRDGFVDKSEFNHYIELPDQAAPAPEEAAPPPPAPKPALQDAVPAIQSQAYATPPTLASKPGESTVPAMPPIGRDETARSLQNHAARTQDTLVDAVENAEVAEIKRSVFRSLFRLRSAQIKEYDTIARMQTQAIDQYNDKHSYRTENPISHLSDLDSDVESDKYATFHDGHGDSEDD